jgi:hypothetical protein
MKLYILSSYLFLCSLAVYSQSVALDTRSSTGTGSWTTRQAKLVNLLLGNSLVTSPTELNQNKYGSNNHISSSATGFFYTKKINGRWWLIDPEGKGGFNIAVNSIPKNTDDTKLGQVYDKLWELGFNGAANFLEDENQTIRYNNTHANQFSYTRRINFHGTYAYKRNEYYPNTPSTGTILNYVFVFDPAFATYCDSRAKTFGDAHKNEPNLLGYFLDNELPFHSDQLLRFLRDLAPGDPCYDAALEFAVSKGLTASQVVTGYSSISDAIKQEFATKVADKYYEITTTAIKKYDPNHLTLGSRLHGGSRAMEGIVKSAAKWCDVVSVNFYDNYSPNNQITASTKYLAWIDKPCMVGEFYTKGYDTYEQGIVNGFSGAGWVVRTQTDRGYFYQNTSLELIASRLFVGWHYFKYYDDADSNKGMFKRPSGEEYTDMTSLMKMMNINRFKAAEYYDKTNAVVTWNGQGGDGKWSTPANWDSNALPSVSDNVIIPENAVVSLTGDAGTINKITINGKLIITESGTLNVEQTTSSAPVFNIVGGELVNSGELNIVQRLNNSNTLLQLSDHTERDSKFINNGMLSIDNTAGSYTSTSGRCVSLKQTTPGRKAYLLLGGIMNVNVKTGCRFIEMEGGTGLISNAQIDGVVTIGSESDYKDWRFLHLNATGNLIIAPTADITFYSGFNSTNGCINVNTINGGTVNLINKGKLTVYGGGTFTTTTPYGICLNPQASATTATNAIFSNEGQITINGNFPGGGVFLTGAAKSGSLPVFRNENGAELNVVNTSSGANASALGSTTTGVTNIHFVNNGTARFISETDFAILLGNSNSVFTNTGLVSVNKSVSGFHGNTTACTFNNSTNGVFNFDLNGVNSIAINASNRIVFNNNGGTVTGKGMFGQSTFNSLNGILSPGGAGTGVFSFSDEAISLTGKCVLNVNGNSEAGTDFDQINTTGTLDISTLEIDFIVNYNPVHMDIVPVVKAGTRTGNFSKINAPANWIVDYLTESANLVYMNETGLKPISAFNGKVYCSVGYLVIEMPASEESVYFQLTDIAGRVCASRIITGTNNRINIKGLKGLFVVRLNALNETYLQKMIL